MMLPKNMKVKFHSPDGDTDNFDIIAGVLQWDILTLYLFIIDLDYVLRTSNDLIKEKGFYAKKSRGRRYPTQTITDADYPVNIAPLAKTPTQAESMLHSLGQTAGGIGLHVNAEKKSGCALIKKRHLQTKWWFSEISGQLHVSR